MVVERKELVDWLGYNTLFAFFSFDNWPVILHKSGEADDDDAKDDDRSVPEPFALPLMIISFDHLQVYIACSLSDRSAAIDRRRIARGLYSSTLSLLLSADRDFCDIFLYIHRPAEEVSTITSAGS